jgi:hypothetical protein
VLSFPFIFRKSHFTLFHTEIFFKNLKHHVGTRRKINTYPWGAYLTNHNSAILHWRVQTPSKTLVFIWIRWKRLMQSIWSGRAALIAIDVDNHKGISSSLPLQILVWNWFDHKAHEKSRVSVPSYESMTHGCIQITNRTQYHSQGP